MARQADWLLGRGGQIFCGTPRQGIAAGGSEDFDFYVWPRDDMVEWLVIANIAPAQVSSQGGANIYEFTEGAAFGTIGCTAERGANDIDDSTSWTIAGKNMLVAFLRGTVPAPDATPFAAHPVMMACVVPMLVCAVAPPLT